MIHRASGENNVAAPHVRPFNATQEENKVI